MSVSSVGSDVCAERIAFFLLRMERIVHVHFTALLELQVPSNDVQNQQQQQSVSTRLTEWFKTFESHSSTSYTLSMTTNHQYRTPSDFHFQSRIRPCFHYPLSGMCPFIQSHVRCAASVSTYPCITSPGISFSRSAQRFCNALSGLMTCFRPSQGLLMGDSGPV